MIKLTFNLDLTADEISKALKENLNAAAAYTVRETKDIAQRRASQKLSSGFKHWNRGFNMDKVADGIWVLSITGKLANMMEDGFGVGAIFEMISRGNRAQHNKAVGKNYVDIPMIKDADSATGKISGVSVKIQQFKNADDVRKTITISDWKKRGIKRENVITQRINNIIRTRNKGREGVKFLTIKRMSLDPAKNSGKWPDKPFPGVKILNELDREIEIVFDKALRSLI